MTICMMSHHVHILCAVNRYLAGKLKIFMNRCTRHSTASNANSRLRNFMNISGSHKNILNILKDLVHRIVMDKV